MASMESNNALTVTVPEALPSSSAGSGVPAVQTMARDNALDVQYSPLTSFESGLVCAAQTLSLPCFPLWLRQVDDFERAVILRLGKRLTPDAGKGGLYVIWPCIDELIRVDVREVSVNVPHQAIVTREGLTVMVDGVVYYRIMDAVKAVFGVMNYRGAVMLLAQTKLREVLGTKTFEQLQADRDGIANQLQQALDEPTNPWGIDITRVELTDVKLPSNIQRAMGQEAEAMRNARAKVIEAEGEKQSAQVLLNAANTIQSNQGAMQLRFLQTLTQVAAENNRTVIMPYPSELTDANRQGGTAGTAGQTMLTSAVAALTR